MPQLEEKISKQAAQGEYNLCPVKSRVMVLIVRIECISFTKNYNFCQLNSARLSNSGHASSFRLSVACDKAREPCGNNSSRG